MPEPIMRKIGLSFTHKELEIMLQRPLDFSKEADLDLATDYLFETHASNDMEHLGFSDDYIIDEISGDVNGLWVYFC